MCAYKSSHIQLDYAFPNRLELDKFNGSLSVDTFLSKLIKQESAKFS